MESATLPIPKEDILILHCKSELQSIKQGGEIKRYQMKVLEDWFSKCLCI